MEVTQSSVAKEFAEGAQACTTTHELVEYGASLFAIPYIDSIVKQCWPIFSKRMGEIDPSDKGKTVTVVDLPAIFHASFASSGDNAVTETMDRIQSALEAVGESSSVIIAMDSRESTRREKFPGYKANRSAKPPEFNSVREDALKNLANNDYTIVMHDGWESDDVMASVAFRAKLRKHTCVIITDDRDLLQCCGNGVTCYSPRSREYHSETWLKANHSITPKQVVDWLCLVGKDDVPAANGIGEKTATGLLSKLGNFWAIFESLDLLVEQKEITKKRADAINEFARSGNYFLARELHELNKRLKVQW